MITWSCPGVLHWFHQNKQVSTKDSSIIVQRLLKAKCQDQTQSLQARKISHQTQGLKSAVPMRGRRRVSVTFLSQFPRISKIPEGLGMACSLSLRLVPQEQKSICCPLPLIHGANTYMMNNSQQVKNLDCTLQARTCKSWCTQKLSAKCKLAHPKPPNTKSLYEYHKCYIPIFSLT